MWGLMFRAWGGGEGGYKCRVIVVTYFVSCLGSALNPKPFVMALFCLCLINASACRDWHRRHRSIWGLSILKFHHGTMQGPLMNSVMSARCVPGVLSQ